MQASDGKMPKTDAANTDQLLCAIHRPNAQKSMYEGILHPFWSRWSCFGWTTSSSPTFLPKRSSNLS